MHVELNMWLEYLFLFSQRRDYIIKQIINYIIYKYIKLFVYILYI